jgi:hypothetical protein
VINQKTTTSISTDIAEHRNPNPSISKSKTSHSNGGKSTDGELLIQNLAHQILCHCVRIVIMED